MSTDASNVGNIKTFSLDLRYFRREVSEQLHFNFLTWTKEDAKTIATAIIKHIEKEGARMKNLIASEAA